MSDWKARARPATYPAITPAYARRVELREFDADDYARPAKPAPSPHGAIPPGVYRDMRALQALVECAPLAAWRIDGLKLPSVANLREHWAPKASRTSKQRNAARLSVPSDLRAWWSAWGREDTAGAHLVVMLVRVSPRPLDGDNLARSAKACRDGIADALGIDDRHPRVSWFSYQETGPHALRVVVVEGRP